MASSSRTDDHYPTVLSVAVSQALKEPHAMAALFVMQRVPLACMAEFAATQLENDDSPALRRLGGFTADDRHEDIEQTFVEALHDLGVTLPLPPIALILVAQHIAQLIVNRELPAYPAAQFLMKLSWELEPPLRALLDPFTYAASEWEDRPEDRTHFEAEILDEARRWLERGSADV